VKPSSALSQIKLHDEIGASSSEGQETLSNGDVTRRNSRASYIKEIFVEAAIIENFILGLSTVPA